MLQHKLLSLELVDLSGFEPTHNCWHWIHSNNSSEQFTVSSSSLCDQSSAIFWCNSNRSSGHSSLRTHSDREAWKRKGKEMKKEREIDAKRNGTLYIWTKLQWRVESCDLKRDTHAEIVWIMWLNLWWQCVVMWLNSGAALSHVTQEQILTESCDLITVTITSHVT